MKEAFYDSDNTFSLDNYGNYIKHVDNTSKNYTSYYYTADTNTISTGVVDGISLSIKEQVISEILEKDEETLGIILNYLRGHLENIVENPEVLYNSKIKLLEDEVNELKCAINNLTNRLEYETNINRELIYDLRDELKMKNSSV